MEIWSIISWHLKGLSTEAQGILLHNISPSFLVFLHRDHVVSNWRILIFVCVFKHFGFGSVSKDWVFPVVFEVKLAFYRHFERYTDDGELKILAQIGFSPTTPCYLADRRRSFSSWEGNVKKILANCWQSMFIGRGAVALERSVGIFFFAKIPPLMWRTLWAYYHSTIRILSQRRQKGPC